MRKGILIGLVLALIFIVFFADFFIQRDFFDRPLNFLASFFSKTDIYEENLLLKQQIEDLKAQDEVSVIRRRKPGEGYLTAKIFSTYPFNIKNTLTLNIGEKEGVKKGEVVTAGKNILLGQVIEVFENKSVVRTVFDPRWQIPVRIGKNEVDGLLSGGIEPKITLLEKGKPLQAGDVVYSASSDFPYGLKIGEIAEIQRSSSGVFREARLKMPYNINDLREARVVISD